MSKKLLILLIVLAVAAAIVCAIFLLPKEETPAPTQREKLNTAATNFALQENKLSKNEILLMESSQREDNGNLTVKFRIYALAEGYSASYFIGMDLETAEANPGLTHMGSATASFLKGDPGQIFGLKVIHER